MVVSFIINNEDWKPEYDHMENAQTKELVDRIKKAVSCFSLLKLVVLRLCKMH